MRGFAAIFHSDALRVYKVETIKDGKKSASTGKSPDVGSNEGGIKRKRPPAHDLTEAGG